MALDPSIPYSKERRESPTPPIHLQNSSPCSLFRFDRHAQACRLWLPYRFPLTCSCGTAYLRTGLKFGLHKMLEPEEECHSPFGALHLDHTTLHGFVILLSKGELESNQEINKFTSDIRIRNQKTRGSRKSESWHRALLILISTKGMSSLV